MFAIKQCISIVLERFRHPTACFVVQEDTAIFCGEAPYRHFHSTACSKHQRDVEEAAARQLHGPLCVQPKDKSLGDGSSTVHRWDRESTNGNKKLRNERRTVWGAPWAP